MQEPDAKQIKKEKKIKKLLKKSAWAAGLGVGLFILKLVVIPLLGVNEEAQKAVGFFALCLIGYGVALVITFAVKKDWMGYVNILLSWVILPAILVKLLTEHL